MPMIAIAPGIRLTYPPPALLPNQPAEPEMRQTNRTHFALAGLLVTLLISHTGCNLAANRQNSLGRSAYMSGQFAQAINNFQQALNSNPNNADAYYNLASSYYQLGKQTQNSQWVQQAEQLYRQAITINDQHVPAHRSLAALLIETGRERYAFDLVDDWRNRYPNSAEPMIEIARLYQEFGDNRRATDFLSDAVRLDSGNIRALKALGHVREAQGQLNLALENYNRVIALDASQYDVAQRMQYLTSRLAQQQQTGGLR